MYEHGFKTKKNTFQRVRVIQNSTNIDTKNISG